MHPLLQPHILLRAYAIGMFPMADDTGQLHWFCPNPRAVILPDKCWLPRKEHVGVCRSRFEIRVDTAFEQVITACSQRTEGTWISREIIEAYCLLHELGFAHSVEAWRDGKLEGGLYGVALGAAFFGESMFHRARGASKCALAWLIRRCQQGRAALIDVQWLTPYLRACGAIEVSRGRYLAMLTQSLRQPTCFLHRHEVRPDWISWHRTPEEAVRENDLCLLTRSHTKRDSLKPDGNPSGR